nr:fatty acid desaturase family protein [Tanacetum cinerariifolium]
MGSKATGMAKNSPKSPSLELNKLITKHKSSMFSIETQNSENKELEYEIKDLVEENQGLKNKLREIKKVNDECLKKLRIYDKWVLDFEVRVSGLENLGKELIDSPDFSDKQKNHVLDNDEDKKENDRKDFLSLKRKWSSKWLIVGDPERKLKKTLSELNCFERDQCRMIAVTYSAELFEVYQKN